MLIVPSFLSVVFFHRIENLNKNAPIDHRSTDQKETIRRSPQSFLISGIDKIISEAVHK